VIGTLIGLVAANAYMKRSGRQSFIVWCLVVIFVLSTIAIPLFGGMSLYKEHLNGADLMEFKSPCPAKV